MILRAVGATGDDVELELVDVETRHGTLATRTFHVGPSGGEHLEGHHKMVEMTTECPPRFREYAFNRTSSPGD